MGNPSIWSGTDEQMLGTGDKLLNNGVPINMSVRRMAEWYDEWDATAVTGNTTWSAFNSGTAAAAAKIAGEAGHPGIVQHTTGSTNSGRSGNIKEATAVLLGGGMGCIFDAVCRFTQLSTTTDEFIFRIGLGDATGNAEHTDGVYLKYDRAANGHFWVLMTSSNSTRTTTVLDGTGGNASIPVAAATWYRVRAEINAAGTSVQFFIDSTAGTKTSVGTITTNIPTGAGRQCCPVYGLFKNGGSSGIGPVTTDMDVWHQIYWWSTQR